MHSNGYSLVRKVIGVDGIKPGTPEAAAKAEELSRPLEELGGASLADALLAPTRIYVKPILELLRGGAPVHAIAHITGGGITENLNRALADDVDAVVTRSGAEMGWDVPPVITYVSRQAELAPNEACKTFNMGVGLCLIVAPEDEAAVTEALAALCEKLGAFYKPEQIGIDPALSEDMLSVSAAIRNRLTLIRMRRVLDFGE